MLLSLKLISFVIFDHLEINFAKGMTVITGITGSGKSVIFDAIEFAFGNKLSRKIDTKDKTAEVTLSFLYKNETIVIRHVKSSNSKFYINNVLTTRATVQEWQHKLVTYQRQNQHTQSLENNYQRAVLDKFSDLAQIVSHANSLYYSWQQKQHELLRIKAQLNQIDLELNAHFLLELEDLAPNNNDWQSLNEQVRAARLGVKSKSNAEKSNALILDVIRKLEQLQGLVPESGNISACINQAIISVQEAAAEITDVNSITELSEYEIEQMESRIQQYFQLARKHKVRPEELSDVLLKYQSEVELSDSLLDLEAELNKSISELSEAWFVVAVKLAERRHLSGIKLAAMLTEKLKKLNLNAKIAINFKLEQSLPGLNGGGELEFLIATKSNQPLRPIAKVVSGGEASRIGLVMQEIFVTSDQVYLMDEVDIGVSGAVASAIGLMLASMAENNQVICITHTPQVAALAENHIAISDSAKILTGNDRVKEIAAMLCHDGLTDAALMQAEELLA